MASKAARQRRHAQNRALERYRIEYSSDLRAQIRSLVRSHQSHIVQRQSNRVSIREVTLDGIGRVRFVWDRSTGEVVTFLQRNESGEMVESVVCDRCGSSIRHAEGVWACPLCADQPVNEYSPAIWAHSLCRNCDEPILLLACAHWHHRDIRRGAVNHGRIGCSASPDTVAEPGL